MARAMKDSGIEWIGQIPKEWEVIRIKYLRNTEKDSFQDGDWIESPYIQDSGIRYLTTGNVGDGVFKQQGNAYISEETFGLLNCKYAYPNDLVIARLNAPYGRSCILPNLEEKYVLAVDIVILRTNHNKKYLNYIMQCCGYQNVVQDFAKGTTMKRISRTNLGNVALPIANLLEQQKIATFLDKKCASIDAVIEKTKISIEEYKKLKQAVIIQAVTKGLQPNRKMKDSGNTWFGEIPEDVSISRVGLHFDIILGKMVCSEKKNEEMEEYPYICAANVHFDGVDCSDLKKMWFTEDEIKQYRVILFDLLVVEGGAGAGGCAMVTDIKDIVGIQNSIQIVRPKNIKKNSNRYLCYLIQSLVKRNYIDVVCNKATIPHFTKDKLSCVPYPVFSIQEQIEIADYLDEKCSAIDNLIEQKENVVEEQTIYKKSLIYEFVTGKKEVPV